MGDAPTISFWGGLGTIGGTRVAVAAGGSRVIFDFGLAYAPGETYYDNRLAPRPGAVLREYLALGCAPPLPHLYRPELAAGTGLPPGPATGPADTAVFISHLHLDHHALTDLVAPGVPVYMHTDSTRMLAALRALGEATPGLPRDVQPLAWDEPVDVGPLRVTALPVDHDIPGASGFLVETPAGAVVYTGDLRLHGAHPHQVHRFMARARALQPRLLLIEGTRLGEAPRPGALTEPDLPARAAERLQACPALALVVLYARNTARVTALKTAARAAGRTLALEAAAAALYARCGGDLQGAAVYLPAPAQGALAAGTAPAWLTRLAAQAAAAGAPLVDAAAVAGAQDQFLLHLSYPHLNELTDLRARPGSVCLHCNGEPLGRFAPGWGVYERWLQRFGVAHVPLGCSGHAAPADLKRIAAGVAPQVLAPVHSLRPELLALPGTPRLLAEYGATYRLDRLA